MSGYLTGWLSGGDPPGNAGGTYTVGILDLDEAAIGAALVTDITVTGPPGVTFLIDLTTYEVTADAPFNLQIGDTVPLTITIELDGTPQTADSLDLIIGSLDQAPEGLANTMLEVNENAAAGTVVAMLEGIDPDAGDTTFAYQVIDSTLFEVVGSELRVAAGATLDHEALASHDITLRVTDGNNSVLFTDVIVTVAVNNLNEAPHALLLLDPADAALPAQLPEAALAGDVVAWLQGHDAEGGWLTYTLLEGAGFAIDGDLLVVDGTVAFDHETSAAANLLIEVADEEGSARQFRLDLPVSDVNEAPIDLVLSADTVSEDAAAGALIGELRVLDPDLNDSFSVTLDEPSTLFEILGNTLRVQAGAALDAETETSYTLSISATDAGGLTIWRAFTITVGDANEAPYDLAIYGTDVVETAADGTVIGLLSASDPDAGDTLSYSLAGPSALFEVVDHELRVRSGATLDFETAAFHDLTILATDANGLSSSLAVTINVADGNDAPSIAARFGVTELRIAENAAAGREVGGVTFSDPNPGDIVSLLLVGQDADRFVLDDDRIRIADAAGLDFETQSSLSFGVSATDLDGLTATQIFTVNLVDVLEDGQSVNTALQGGGVYAGLQVQFDQDQAMITVGGNQIIVPLTGEVELADGTLSFGDGTMVAAVERLYLSMLGRGGDGGGRMFWQELVEDGQPLSLIAQNFLDSPEFNSFVSSFTGAPSYAAVTNAEFTSLLYQRVLGRSPDQDGMNFWVGGLNAGAISRADMLSGFILSDEARERFADQTSQIWVVDQDALMVRSLYDIALGREPDADGLAFWKNAMESGMPLGALADMIVGSPEFQTMLAQNSITEMVTQFYVQGLERAPEQDGLAFWSGLIAGGAADWSDILVAIAMSPEQQAQFTDYRDGVGIFNIT